MITKALAWIHHRILRHNQTITRIYFGKSQAYKGALVHCSCGEIYKF